MISAAESIPTAEPLILVTRPQSALPICLPFYPRPLLLRPAC
jgi:hypothetical protein